VKCCASISAGPNYATIYERFPSIAYAQYYMRELIEGRVPGERMSLVEGEPSMLLFASECWIEELGMPDGDPFRLLCAGPRSGLVEVNL